MAYRITLECGDTSNLRAKKTAEGYTHDWKVYVRGVDNAPIHHFIDKVVFNLHETFAKPKRTFKEPPYVLEESGYAGFDIPIDIYLKNKNEPKRFQIMYNLYLEQSGPGVSHTSHHNHTFHNPSDEFRKKLLKGGATPISSSENVSEKNEVKTLPMVGKPKLSGNDNKKHRIPEQKLTNSFMDIFGDPVKHPSKPPPEKKPVDKSLSSKATLPVPEKSDKNDKSTKPKHSPHKDTKKDKSSEDKKDRRDKEKDVVKDKDKVKDKSKRSSSPTSNKTGHHSTDSKRPSSPMLMKKPTTPPSASKRAPSPPSKSKEKDRKITEPEKERDRSKDSSKSTPDESKSDKGEKESKSERKKDKKKHKEDRDKDKKEKHKDKEREKSKDKECVKIPEKKVEKIEKPVKEKLLEVKDLKEERKSPKPVKEVEKVKEEKIVKIEKPEKHKDSKIEKPDKSKHKHKKRDKKDKRDGSRERDKKDKRDKSKTSTDKHNEVINHTSTSSAAIRVPEPQSRDSSDSESDDDDSIGKNRTPNPVKKPSPSPSPSPETLKSMSPPPPPVSDPKKDKSDKKREKSKSSREDKEKKKKRKSESRGLDDEISPKKVKSERDHSTSPLVEPVSSSQSPIAANLDALHSKIKHEQGMSMDTEAATGDSEQVAPDSTIMLVDTEETAAFSEDYVSQLKDLQQKIMTLQDNDELQRVVSIIAETGQFEVTKKTFDFDLCTLDRRTVARLQQFFAS